ncbi:DUF3592 domain-containing protein [Pedobacter sp. UYP1]|uniref:DUF3592 domain-containing protein n=1 Tax=Pedobacter sp. UYP1 TaxID=1756396 RepID=UPI003398E85D
MQSTEIKIGSLFFIIVGILLIVGDLVMANRNLEFIRKGVVTEGVVILTKYGRFHPDIRFNTTNNEMITFPQNGLNKGYKVHDTMSVLYDPNHPNNACINSFGPLWGHYLAFLIMGLVFVVLGTIKLLYPNTSWFYFNFEK